MGVALRVWNALDDFFFAPRAIHALVLARIIFGATLFLCGVNRLPDSLALYGPDGLLGPELASQIDTEDLYGSAPWFAAFCAGANLLWSSHLAPSSSTFLELLRNSDDSGSLVLWR